ncbi:hypothetical protein B1R94_09065 [Mycolicibacterium litorale]|nr:hypothetical protein B1R94_09065 [Mycolicibacterium litorale]
MLWVTRKHIHLDRVASAWLIRRFVDREAHFAFLDQDEEGPPDSVPFALPGAEIGPHDDRGSTFRKILDGYSLGARELARMADVVEAAMVIAQDKELPPMDMDSHHFAATLVAFSEAMLVLRPDDHENLRASSIYYDALYQMLWATSGSAPVVASGGIVTRVLTYRAAVDWAVALPMWTDEPRS